MAFTLVLNCPVKSRDLWLACTVQPCSCRAGGGSPGIEEIRASSALGLLREGADVG